MRRQVLIPAIVSLCIVFANLFFQFKVGINNPNFGDSEDYLFAARKVYSGVDYPRIFESFPFFRAPGYPYIIAAIWNLTFYNSILVLKVFNSICVGLLSLAVYKLARRKLTRNVSLIAMVLASLNPFVTLQSKEVGTETLTTLVFLVFLLLLTSKESKKKPLLLGLIILLVSCLRPEYFFLCASSVILFYIIMKKNPKKVIWVFLIPIIGINYWGLQNKEITGSYIPLTNATSFQLWMGSTEIIYRNYPLSFADTPTFNDRQNARLQAEIKSIEAGWGKINTLNQLERRSNLWLKEYLKNVSADKQSYVVNTAKKMLVFWRPFISPTAYNPTLVYLSLGVLLPFMILTFFGSFIAIKSKHYIDEIVIVMNSLIWLTIIHGVQMPDFRYRVPVFFPFSTVIVCYLLSQSPIRNLRLKRLFGRMVKV